MLLPEKALRLQFLESNVVQRVIDAGGCLANANALLHLKHGLGARHYVLRHCREYLERTCFAAKNVVLSADTATEAALHLNGYYLNLRGALDNLAWVIQFELQLFPGVTEDSGTKMKVNLFGDDFLRTLRRRSVHHAAPVVALRNWGIELSALRDPAAHRIPLYVPPGLITSQEQADEFRRLDALSGAPEEELAGRSRIEIMLEARRTASFVPMFCVTSSKEIKPYRLPKQLLSDHRRYLHLVRKVLGAFKKQTLEESDEGSTIFGDPLAATIPDPEHSIDENRFVTTGVSSLGRLLVVCYCEDEPDDIHIISAREATPHEKKQYEG